MQIGNEKFTFVTKNQGAVGGASREERDYERKLIEAMKKGSGMKIAGRSSGGTLTKDSYSLAGISAALDKIDQSWSRPSWLDKLPAGRLA